jgi:iron complex transport system substrate-binding protein
MNTSVSDPLSTKLRKSPTKPVLVFAVNNAIWQTGEGIVAARGILADLGLLDAPIN